MAHASLPAADSLAATLTKIIGREVRAKAAKSAVLPPLEQAFVASYDDGSAAGALEGLWVAELALAASFGASLTLVPYGVATEGVRAKKIPPELQENAREIANITANSFGDKRVRLANFWAPGEALTPEVRALAAAKGSVVELAVEIASYGGGKLWLVGHPAAPK